MSARSRASMLSLWLLALIGAGMLVFVAANIHYLLVAIESQPECVPHLKTGESSAGQFSAAKSAC